MFIAKGVGVKRDTETNTITVAVDFIDERITRVVLQRKFSGPDVATIRTAIVAQLTDLAAADDDAALNAAIVGKTIARI
jgi:hypothetical protein